MERSEYGSVSSTDESHQADEALTAQFDRTFKPKGAIAFFVLLVALGLLIWYGIYFLMLERM